MDGGFTDNLVLLDEHTMTVSPFRGESDICSRDGESSNAFHGNSSLTISPSETLVTPVNAYSELTSKIKKCFIELTAMSEKLGCILKPYSAQPSLNDPSE
ncbi:hypothetical protein QYM36_018112 [Artemia franciscana]|uniref:Uncharacterized protein n=1 Tax=Artemia franciscana TaxID=6661 RepID=A0AA88HDK7_ARTSF|nr:hypothetical protein QYM36_018112 [Artemia franciscana]